MLYVRPDCHLCGPAREVVSAVCAELAETWHEVNIDQPGVGANAADLRSRYGDYVPVVVVDGMPQGFWTIEPDRLRRALSK